MIIGPKLNRKDECETILRSLPKWFGIEEGIRVYVRDSALLPGFAVESDGRLSGFISLKEHYPRAWEVHCIAVLASERSKGIGTKLLDQAEAWLASKGVRFLQIKTVAETSTDPYYTETRKFYIARGYEPVEIFPDLWAPTNPALQLVKYLGPA